MLNDMAVVTHPCPSTPKFHPVFFLTPHLEQGPYLAIKHFLLNLKQSSMAKLAEMLTEFGCITHE